MAVKQGERLNNYTYAVGGKDTYKLPMLGEAGDQSRVDDDDADSSKKTKPNKDSQPSKDANSKKKPKEPEPEEE